MKAKVHASLLITWILLVGITLLSWGWGSGRDLRLQASAALLVLAFVKIRLIMRHFMGVRSAPAAMRWVCDGWLLCTCLALIITIEVVEPAAASAPSRSGQVRR